MPIQRKRPAWKKRARPKYVEEDEEEEDDDEETVVEEGDDKPRPCQICKYGFKPGQKRKVCQTDECPSRFQVHTECLKSQADEHVEVRIFCRGCRKTTKYEPTTRMILNRRSLFLALVVIVLVLGLSFLPYQAWVWFAQDYNFPQAKRARSWLIQVAYSWLVICFTATCGAVIYYTAQCCCMPCFLVCGICRRGGPINY